jgi:hypothetical protein
MDPGPQQSGFAISLAWRRAGRDLRSDHGISAASGRGSFPATAQSAQKFLGHFRILPELFSVFYISTGKNLGFLTFAPKIFGPGNFRPEFFWIFQLSNRKKFPETQIPEDPAPTGLRRRSELVTELTPFFQLSRQLFFNFSTFNRKIFRPGTFGPKKSGRPEFQRERARFDRSCGNVCRLMRSVGGVGTSWVFFRVSQRSSGNFLGSRTSGPEKRG